MDDWKKLGRCVKHLHKSKELPLILKANKDGVMRWWIDASFAAHPDMRSHTRAAMSLGSGCPISMSRKQQLNTKSSTKSELVGVDDSMPLVIWVRNFLTAQSFCRRVPTCPFTPEDKWEKLFHAERFV